VLKINDKENYKKILKDWKWR